MRNLNRSFICLLVILCLFGSVKMSLAATNVHNLNLDIWYTNIVAALTGASNGHVIEVHPGIYTQTVNLSYFTNLILRSYVYATSGNKSSTIINASGKVWAIVMTNGHNNRIQGFSIKRAGEAGILLTGASKSNYVGNNIIYSNFIGGGGRGIALHGDNSSNVNFNTIESNILFKNTDGIRLDRAKYNNIFDNIAHHHTNDNINSEGIIVQIGISNRIRGNILYSNTGAGIALHSSWGDYNIVTNNTASDCFYGFRIYDANHNRVKNNNLKNSLFVGAYVRGPTNTLSYNVVYSNPINVYLDSTGMITNFKNRSYKGTIGFFITNCINVLIKSNEAYDNTNGIFLKNSSGNGIQANKIYRNSMGINLQDSGFGSSQNNKIVNNSIYSNSGSGIRLNSNSGNSTSIFSNSLLDNNAFGIQIFHMDSTKIFNNPLIRGGQVGIFFDDDAEQTVISNNYITLCSRRGIYACDGGINSWINLNTIVSNYTGVFYSNSSTTLKLTRNNIYSNIYLNVTNHGIHATITSNWWGTTLAYDIKKSIDSTVTFNEIIPYRLFDKFNIEYGADINYLPVISSVTAFIASGQNVALRWQKTSSMDFSRYNIYRTTAQSLWSNLTAMDVIATVNNVSATNFTNYNVPVGTYTYYITAMDNPAPPFGSVYTNECWYSPKGQVTVSQAYTNVYNLNTGAWYSNITTALAEASNGHTLEVHPGIYQENLDLSGFERLTIRSYLFVNYGDNTKTIIDGGGNDRTIRFDNTKNCRLIGMGIKGGDNQGIFLDNDSYSNYIANNYIFSNDMYGIHINHDNADYNIIVSNEIFANIIDGADYCSIRINEGDYTVVKYNNVYNNRQAGIILRDHTKRNFILRNTSFSNSRYGILLNGGNVLSNTIMSNTCYGNDFGIYLNNTQNGHDIIGNVCYKNSDTGIWVRTPDNLLQYNRIYSNAFYGIYIENTAYNTNYGNILFNNGYGIYVDSQPNAIRSNRIYNCTNSGIYLNNADNSFVFRNSISNCPSGIHLYESEDCQMFENTAQYCDYGYNLWHGGGSARRNVIKNSFIYSNEYGIFFAGDRVDDTSIVSNRILNQNKTGINAGIGDNNNIRQNILGLCREYGITINAGSDNTTLSNNYIYGCSNYGIWANDGTGLKINLNTIVSNRIGIGYWDSVVSADFRYNNIYDNDYLGFTNSINPPGIITNIWWGTTKASEILSSISRNLTISDIVPYRLFGKYNIVRGADTGPPPHVNNVTANVIGNDVTVNWLPSVTAVRYFIYRTNVNAWSNFQRNNVMGCATALSWTNNNLPVGTYYYWVTALDNPSSVYTNETWYSTNISVTISGTVPSTVRLIYPASNSRTNNNDVYFKWYRALDSVSGISNYNLQISTNRFLTYYRDITNNGETSTNYTSNNLTEGTNFWRVRAGNRAGSWGNFSNIWLIVVDTTGPFVSIGPPADTFISSVSNVTFNWLSSDMSGVLDEIIDFDTDNNLGNGFEVSVNTNSPYTHTFSSEGNMHWRVRAIDILDNPGISVTNSFIIDTSPPQKVTLVSPPNNSTTNSNNINFQWNKGFDAISGVSNYVLKVTNYLSGWGSRFTINSTNQIVLAIPDGTYYWYVRARDRAGHSGVWSVTNRFVITAADTNNPYFSDIWPYPDQNNVATNADIFFNVFDNIAVSSQSILVRINGQTALSNGSFRGPIYSGIIRATNSGYRVRVNPPPFAPQTNVSIYLYAEDLASNSEETNYVFYTIDTWPPYIIATSPLIGQVNVAVQSNIYIYFNETMNTTNISCFSIKEEHGTTISGGLYFSSNTYINDTLIFNPNYFLPNNSSLTVIISTNIRDIIGNRLLRGTNFYFRTIQNTNRIISIDPADGSESVPINTSIRIQFNSSMDPSSTAAFSILPLETGNYLWENQIYFNDTLVFDPLDYLPTYTIFQCSVSTNAISLGGSRISDQTNFSFTTGGDLFLPEGAVEVDVFDIRPNLMSLSKNEFIEFFVNLPEATGIDLEIFNIAGERVFNLPAINQKQYKYKWYGMSENNIKQAAPGAYFAVMKTDNGLKKVRVFYIIK
ncbi:MAG: right-handed parallel beta-helix repeat-containing protein [Spirochaetes bacterium]|nr:right-handed parallel beta-helix repeat-containing protein [Spirochaetota bacterium]